ncbi:hypothetical protein [Bradyrhizobium betae]|uniref:hypothetical protein n=1 Tax=Bradyrhizobium betae TaxID=244734 RepID=UPI00142E9C5D|nr:hypothetical protein [Bradyrhizobium betae]MCS3726957.1 hypothetical protein [Bradyrhizobium betae]
MTLADIAFDSKTLRVIAEAGGTLNANVTKLSGISGPTSIHPSSWQLEGHRARAPRLRLIGKCKLQSFDLSQHTRA